MLTHPQRLTVIVAGDRQKNGNPSTEEEEGIREAEVTQGYHSQEEDNQEATKRELMYLTLASVSVSFLVSRGPPLPVSPLPVSAPPCSRMVIR